MSTRKDKNSASYIAITSGGGAIQRIRTPTPTDILLGRGGSINSHPGNQVFREWVKTRREDYNLARSKQDKMKIARLVMDKVHDAGGRFLQKDPTTSIHWWVEVDDIRALAKTAQALREGAPQIRAAHQEMELPQPTKKRRVQPQGDEAVERPVQKRTRPETPTSPPKVGTVVMVPPTGAAVSPDPYRSAIKELRKGYQKAQLNYRPLMSNTEFGLYHHHQSHENPQDDANLNSHSHHHGHEQEVYMLEEPNLLVSIPHMPHELPPSTDHDADEPMTPPPIPSLRPIRRLNSLAFSDTSDLWTQSGNGDYDDDYTMTDLDFVNPFSEEMEALYFAQQDSRSETPIIGNLDSSDRIEYHYNSNEPKNTDENYFENIHNLSDFNEEVIKIFDRTDANEKEMPTLLLPVRKGILHQRYGSSSSMTQEATSLGLRRRSVSPH